MDMAEKIETLGKEGITATESNTTSSSDSENVNQGDSSDQSETQGEHTEATEEDQSAEASATAEGEQSDQEQTQEASTEEEKKLERRRKRREFLRKALVFTAGVATGAASIAIAGSGVGTIVAVAALGGSAGTAMWKKSRENKSRDYLSQYHNILEKAQREKRELTEEEKQLREQYLEKSEKASKTANTLGYISTFLSGGAVGASVMSFLEPTIVDMGFKINPEGWFQGFINTLKPERVPINESFGG
jgi:DNA mismatch repair ATPase MutL